MKIPSMLPIIISFLMCSAVLEAKSYTLDQLIVIGHKTSPEIKQIRKEMEKVNAQIDEAYGRAMPSISVSANYQYVPQSFDAMTAGLGQLGSDGISMERALSSQVDAEPGALALSRILDQSILNITNMQTPKQMANIGISLQQPLFAQGKVTTGLKIAKSTQRSLVCKMQDAEQRCNAQITRLFYNTLLAGENVKVQNEAEKIARETHRLAIIRHALGSGSELDTLSSQLRLQQIQIEAENAQSDYRMAVESLIEWTGIKDDPDSVRLSGNFPKGEYVISLDEALVRMERDNKELGRLQSGEQIHEHLLTMSKTDFLPKVYAGAALGKVALFDRQYPISWHDDQKVSAGIQMDLFTGVQRLNRVRQARADLERFRINRKDVISKLSLAVKSTHKKMLLARKQVNRTESMIALAQKGHEIAKRAYEVGQKTLVELQNAELQLMQSRMGHNAARLNFYMAVIDLRLLMGDFNADYRQSILD